MGYLTMFNQLILDICSLALDTFSSSNRRKTETHGYPGYNGTEETGDEAEGQQMTLV